MKITLENFGIIEKFEFDTENNFTFIIGANNTGKSYAMTAIYLIIKNIRYLIEDFNAINYSEYTVNDLLESILKLEIEHFEFIDKLNSSFENSFDSIVNLQNKFIKNKLKIIIETKILKLTIKINKNKMYFDEVTVDEESITIIEREYETEESYSEKLDETYLEEYCSYSLSSQFETLENIYYLPASRSGIYQSMNSFGQIFAELSQKRSDISYDIKIPAMSVPISDYYINLVTIKDDKNKDRNLEVDKITSEIENNILNGKILFNKENKKLTFSPNNTDLNLDLAFTSSMVSEITPIVAYLRYVVSSKESPIIMIEEPEAHLHPEVQIALLKHFIELSKHNIKFIITTHSNYMFNQFNNLILSKDINIKRASCLFFDKSEYGTDVISMELDELGIEDENFIYTSEKLYNERIDIVDKLNDLED